MYKNDKLGLFTWLSFLYLLLQILCEITINFATTLYYFTNILLLIKLIKRDGFLLS